MHRSPRHVSEQSAALREVRLLSQTLRRVNGPCKILLGSRNMANRPICRGRQGHWFVAEEEFTFFLGRTREPVNAALLTKPLRLANFRLQYKILVKSHSRAPVILLIWILRLALR